MKPVLAWLKQWAYPLARTFVVVFVLVFVAGLAKINFQHVKVSDLSILGSLATAAVGTALNTVVIGIQKLLPGLPDPVAPSIAAPVTPVVVAPMPGDSAQGMPTS